MIDTFSKADITTLLAAPEGKVLSLFMPTQRAGPTAQQNQIRLKNLLRDAEESLNRHGLRSEDIKSLLAPIQELIRDARFWQYQGGGLAIFSAPGLFRAYRLPIAFNERVVVGNRCYIRPLIPLLSGDGHFYILALSKNQVRLLRGSRSESSQAELQGVPVNLADTLKYDEYQKQFQFHPGLPGRGGSRGTIVVHSQGAEVDVEKNNLLRYIQQVEHGVAAALRGKREPLVLAGVEYVLAMYREVNSYPYLIGDGIVGNPDHLSAEELHMRAWPIVQSLFQQAQYEAARRYQSLQGTQPGLTSHALRIIIAAAFQGRVATLFVADGPEVWGIFDPITGMVRLHKQALAGAVDLVDLAAAQVMIHGGDVYMMQADQAPESAPLAAIFAY